MLKMALFDCASNEKCCSVDEGRGSCPLFSSPPRGVWQLKSPHPREFAIQGKKNANARGSARGGAGRRWNWLMHNCLRTSFISNFDSFDSFFRSEMSSSLNWILSFNSDAFFSTLFVFCFRSCTSSSKRDTFSSILARLAETSLRCASILSIFSNLFSTRCSFRPTSSAISRASNTSSVSLFLLLFSSGDWLKAFPLPFLLEDIRGV